MIEIIKKELCCGCYSCINICPKKCILMEVDNEGFWYPKVDKKRCINCNLCVNVCQMYKSLIKEEFLKSAYACKNLDEDVRINSSSGGIFNILCEEVINLGGVVFGAAFNKDFEVYHTYAENINDCYKFRGSKYVQSKIGNTYKQAKLFLENGRIVLFSGTQCQIKGLNLYLNKKYDNLITVDIICHGVPSPKVFKSYIKNLSINNNSAIRDIKFRDKKNGWREYNFVIEFKNNIKYRKTLDKDLYMKGFLNNLYLRPSCYKCTAKNFTNSSDISLADYWGIRLNHPELDDDKGVSLVIINNKNGEKIFNLISNKIDSILTDLDFAIEKNKCIIKPVNYNKNRDNFFNEFNGYNLDKLIKKYTKVSPLKYIKKRIRKIGGKIIRYIEHLIKIYIKK